MRYAINLRGEEITARNPGPFRAGLTCPVCKAPVFLRAGERREAHFAHYGHTAKPECVLYTSTSAGGASLAGHRGVEPRRAQDWAFSRVAYFLGASAHEKYSLTIRLPAMSDEVCSLGGEIQIHAGMGLRPIPARRLNRVNLIGVLPRMLGVDIEGTEALREIGQTLARQASLLGEHFNLFHGSEPAGRLLDSNEPLEWGRSYRILTREVLLLPHVEGLLCQRREWREGWDVYEIVLPSDGEAVDNEARRAIERLFARKVRAARTRVYVIEPQPHHVEDDGTLVFPEGTRSALLRVTGPEECVPRLSDGRALAAGEIGGGWLQIADLEPGDFVVEVGGQAALLGRIEGCEFFQPAGIFAEKGSVSVELFDSRLAGLIAELGPDGWAIRCPSAAVADAVALEADGWTRSDGSFYGNLSNLMRFDAGAFGRFEANKQGAHTKETESERPIDSLSTFRRTWLEGVVAARHGRATVHALSAVFETGGNAPNVPEIRYLLPHILAASRTG